MAYIFQAPKDYDAQSAKFKKQYESTAAKFATGECELQLKYDGVFSAMFTTEAEAITRQQKPQPAAGPLARTVRAIFGNNHIVFSELWMPNTKHKDINGASRRDAEQPQLEARVFDIITLDEFNAGVCKVPYSERIGRIRATLARAGSDKVLPVDMVPLLDSTSDKDLTAYATDCKRSKMHAFDGLILRDMSAIWTPGASKNGEVLKIKPSETLDLLIVAQTAVQRETKLGGFVTVEYKGVKTDVGSGLTQEMLAGIMLHNNGDTTHPDALNLVGKIGEFSYLTVTDDGRLREPRIDRIRHDAQREEDK